MRLISQRFSYVVWSVPEWYESKFGSFGTGKLGGGKSFLYIERENWGDSLGWLSVYTHYVRAELGRPFWISNQNRMTPARRDCFWKILLKDIVYWCAVLRVHHASLWRQNLLRERTLKRGWRRRRRRRGRGPNGSLEGSLSAVTRRRDSYNTHSLPFSYPKKGHNILLNGPNLQTYYCSLRSPIISKGPSNYLFLNYLIYLSVPR